MNKSEDIKFQTHFCISGLSTDRKQIRTREFYKFAIKILEMYDGSTLNVFITSISHKMQLKMVECRPIVEEIERVHRIKRVFQRVQKNYSQILPFQSLFYRRHDFSWILPIQAHSPPSCNSNNHKFGWKEYSSRLRFVRRISSLFATQHWIGCTK